MAEQGQDSSRVSGDFGGGFDVGTLYRSRRKGRLDPRVSRIVLAALVISLWTGSTIVLAMESASDDPSVTDYWARVARAPGIPDGSMFAGFENGEHVSLLSGNQLITHPSSSAIPIDGGRELQLLRVYNSTNARVDSVKIGCTHTLGCGGSQVIAPETAWTGKGWTSHLGRVFVKSLPAGCQYRGGEFCGAVYAMEYSGRQLYYEDANGTQYTIAATNGPPAGHGVAHAEPRLRFRFYTHGSSTCPSSAYTNGGSNIECLPSTRGFAYYEVTYPDGVRYLLKYLIPDVIEHDSCSGSDLNWIANYRTSGWYTFEITDLDNRTVYVTYEGTGPHPEAIREISYTFNGGTEAAFTTDLWTQADVGEGPGQTSSINVGCLKALHAPAIDGQPVTYEFEYNGNNQLSKVTLPGNVESISYEYSTKHLSKITYPTGAVSAYGVGLDVLGERTSCQGPQEVNCWVLYGDHIGCNEGPDYYACLENECNNTPEIWERELVVASRTIYPEGEGTGKPRLTWSWDRFHAHDFQDQYGTGGGAFAPVVNRFTETGPDGAETRSQIHGMVYPENTNVSPSYYDPRDGKETVREYRDGAGTAVRRDGYTNVAWNEASLLQKTVTTYLDDTGTCFGENSPSIPKAMTTRYADLSGWGRYRMEIMEGDYLKGGGRRVSYRHYEDGETAPQSRVTNHAIGAYDYSYLDLDQA